MSFLSGNTKSYAAPEQKSLGLEPRKLSTNEQARPVPVVLGSPEVGITFLSQAFDQVSKGQKEDFGKEDRVVGYDYYCSFAALVGHGPIDRLNYIKFDGEQVWPASGDPGITRDMEIDKVVRIKVLTQGSGYTAGTSLTISGTATAIPVIKNGRIVEAIVTGQGSGYTSVPSVTASVGAGAGATFLAVLGSETFAPVTIEYQGRTFTWRFYWGMEDTDYDPLLLTLSPDIARNPDGVVTPNVPENHPAYVGQSYFVAVQQYLGYNKTSVQQIELGVSRFPQSSILENPSNVQDDCNPVAVLVDALENTRYGLGVPFGRLAVDNLNEIAALLEAEGNAISPVITRSTTFREFLISVLEYFDGYQFADDEGRFGLGLIRPTLCVEEDEATPYYDETCLTEVPKLDPVSWEGTANYVYVTYTNRDNGHKEDSIGVPNTANWQITGEPSSETLQRPWFTRPSLVDGYARAMSQVMGIPKQSGRLVLRKSKLQSLQVGGIFKLQYGHLGLCYLWCRAREIRWPNPYRAEVEVSFEVDRGFLTQRTYQAPIYSPPKAIVQPLMAIAHRRLIELPYVADLAVPSRPHVLALVAKPTPMTDGFAIHLVENDVAKRLKRIENFAYYGTVASSFAKGDTGHLTMLLDGIETTLPSVVNIDATSNAWLLFAGDEIMAITHAELIDAETHEYELTVLRERWDTARLDHAAGEDLFLISRTAATGAIVDGSIAEVTPWLSPNTADFQLQPLVHGTGQSLSDIPVTSVTFTDRSTRYWKPRDLEVNGTKWYEGNGSYSAGGGLNIQWVRTNRADPKTEDNLQDLWYVEFAGAGDVVVSTLTAAATDDALHLTNADLQGVFGGEPARFFVRIYAQQIADGTPVGVSRYSDEMIVDKV